MPRRVLILLVISVAVSVLSQAQDTAKSTDAVSTNNSGASAADSTAVQPTAKPSSAKTADRSQNLVQTREMGGLRLIAGNVVQASGEAPLERIMIKRVCPTQTFTEGYTDASGHFLIELGANAALATMSASVGSTPMAWEFGRPGTALLRSRGVTFGVQTFGCALVADAPGYRSNSIVLTNWREMNPSVASTIILTPLDPRAQAATVSVTSLAAPKKAKAAFEKAEKELDKGQVANEAKAITGLERAVELHPKYAEAWTVLGQAKGRMGDLPGAEAALTKAIEADPGYVRPYEPLMLMRFDQQRWEEVSELATFILSVNPYEVRPRWFKAVSEFTLGHHDSAIALLDEIQADEMGAHQYPQTHHIRGLIFAQRGMYAEAASDFERYLELAPDDPAAESLSRQVIEWKESGVI